MRSLLTALTALVATAVLCQCLTFTPTEFAIKLKELGVSDWDIPTLVCVAHNASDLKTGYIGKRVDIGYNYYGIFGIPDKLFNHNPCSHLTKALTLDDDIADDVECMMKMIKDGGYLFGNRSSSLGVFTPHDVDLTKCFDWWESLPPFSPLMTTQNHTTKCVEVEEPKPTSAQLTDEKKDVVDHPSYSLQCATGALTNVLLFVISLSLLGLVCLGYFLLKQIRINQAIIKFNDNSLLM